jgi:hypothetical protein
MTAGFLKINAVFEQFNANWHIVFSAINHRLQGQFGINMYIQNEFH